jgi:predicted RNA-binding Zn-ribbon protein involved in translation (DUF1610 family)
MSSCKNCKALLPSDGAIIFCPNCGETIWSLEKQSLQEKEGKSKMADFSCDDTFCIFIASIE